jgi:RNA polymerase sigma-70 factor (family 1)
MHIAQSADLLDEKELLVKIAAGDEHAFASVFRHHHKLVYDFALRLTRSKNHAEEVVQKIFIRIWLNRAKLADIENFAAYLNRSARNESYSVLRTMAARAVREVELTDEGLICSSDSTHRLIYKESSALLKKAVESLPPQRKLVYQLCHEEGLKYEEVALQLNISPGTVHKHMKLALKSIREKFRHLDAVVVAVLLLNKW